MGFVDNKREHEISVDSVIDGFDRIFSFLPDFFFVEAYLCTIIFLFDGSLVVGVVMLNLFLSVLCNKISFACCIILCTDFRAERDEHEFADLITSWHIALIFCFRSFAEVSLCLRSEIKSNFSSSFAKFSSSIIRSPQSDSSSSCSTILSFFFNLFAY